MSIIPSRNNTTVIQGATGFNLDNVEVNEVPYKSTDGTLEGSGLMMLSSGSLLAPVGFSVESGSVDFGDVIRLSESASYLAVQNMVDNSRYQVVDYAVPRNAASSKPYLFQLIEAEHTFQATNGSGTLTSAVSFDYTTQLTARTNALILTTRSAMTNVRMRIRDKASNVALKYFPSKGAWLTGKEGTSLATGDNILDFQDTALVLTAGTTLTFEILADNYSLVGDNGVAKFSGVVQQGVYVGLTTATELNAVKASIPASSVTSVNGMTGVVTIPSATPQVSSDWDSTTSPSLILNKPVLFDGKYASLSNVPTTFSPTPHTHVIADVTGLQTALDGKLGTTASVPYSQITGTPIIPAAQVNSDWNATSGLAMILNKPVIPTVNYPVISVNGKVGTVVLSATDVGAIATGSAIPYSSLTGTPTAVTKTSQLTNDSGYVTSVTFPVTSVNTKTGAVSLSYLDVGAAATNHIHAISDVTGLQSTLDGKITTGASIPFSTLTGKPTTLGGYGITDGVTQTSLTTTLSGYVTSSTLTSGLSAKFNTPTGTTTQYIRGDGSLATLPLIPTVVSAFTNDAAYITATNLPNYRRVDNSVVTAPIKVKYYTATSDANSVWTVALGTDFTEVLDVQVTAVSSGTAVTGVRQASLNAYTSTSTSLTGVTMGNAILTTLLISAGANTLALIPNTVVKLTVTGK